MMPFTPAPFCVTCIFVKTFTVVSNKRFGNFEQNNKKYLKILIFISLIIRYIKFDSEIHSNRTDGLK